MSKITIQVDYLGARIKDVDADSFYLGLQAGYGIFLGNNVSVEPGIRYNISLNKNFTEPDTISSSLLSKLIINLSKLLGAVYSRGFFKLKVLLCIYELEYVHKRVSIVLKN